MPYLYGLADTKFIKKKPKKKIEAKPAPPVEYFIPPLLASSPKFNHHDVPIQFRASPSTLVELCVNVVDKLPISDCYEWDDRAIRLWIKRYGYPQYMNTFRVNMVTGRKLLLLDASALSAMNIKDFDHIKHITYGIRMLFHFHLTKFSHSIADPDEHPNELYLLFHTQTGVNYDEVRRSDLYRRMQLIREKPLNLGHWELLELWLRREREYKFNEILPMCHRYNMYKCSGAQKKQLTEDEDLPAQDVLCKDCMPPCFCHWTKATMRQPWRLSCLKPPTKLSTVTPVPSKMKGQEQCKECIPPCECRWPSRYYLTGTVIRCLQEKFPEKFAPIFDERMQAVARPSLIERWTRFSI